MNTFLEAVDAYSSSLIATLVASAQFLHGSISPKLFGKIRPESGLEDLQALLLESSCIEWTQQFFFPKQCPSLCKKIINRLSQTRYSARTLRYVDVPTPSHEIVHFLQHDCQVLEKLIFRPVARRDRIDIVLSLESTLGHLGKTLQHLDIYGTAVTLTDYATGMPLFSKSLTNLLLSDLSMPNEQLKHLRHLKCLSHLSLVSLDKLTRLDDDELFMSLNGNLRHLGVQNCDQLEDVSGVGLVQSLEELSLQLFYSEALAHLSGVEYWSDFPHLTAFYLEGYCFGEDMKSCSSSDMLKAIKFPKLEILSVQGAQEEPLDAPKILPLLQSSCSTLKVLQIERVALSAEILDVIGTTMTQLQQVTFSDCQRCAWYDEDEDQLIPGTTNFAAWTAPVNTLEQVDIMHSDIPFLHFLSACNNIKTLNVQSVWLSTISVSEKAEDSHDDEAPTIDAGALSFISSLTKLEKIYFHEPRNPLEALHVHMDLRTTAQLRDHKQQPPLYPVVLSMREIFFTDSVCTNETLQCCALAFPNLRRLSILYVVGLTDGWVDIIRDNFPMLQSLDIGGKADYCRLGSPESTMLKNARPELKICFGDEIYETLDE